MHSEKAILRDFRTGVRLPSPPPARKAGQPIVGAVLIKSFLHHTMGCSAFTKVFPLTRKAGRPIVGVILIKSFLHHTMGCSVLIPLSLRWQVAAPDRRGQATMAQSCIMMVHPTESPKLSGFFDFLSSNPADAVESNVIGRVKKLRMSFLTRPFCVRYCCFLFHVLRTVFG